jgi:hypothetical protein
MNEPMAAWYQVWHVNVSKRTLRNQSSRGSEEKDPVQIYALLRPCCGFRRVNLLNLCPQGLREIAGHVVVIPIVLPLLHIFRVLFRRAPVCTDSVMFSVASVPSSLRAVNVATA